MGELEFHTHSRTRSSDVFALLFVIHKQRGEKKKGKKKEGFLKIRIGSIFRIEKNCLDAQSFTDENQSNKI
jgi:hypothetical protein